MKKEEETYFFLGRRPESQKERCLQELSRGRRLRWVYQETRAAVLNILCLYVFAVFLARIDVEVRHKRLKVSFHHSSRRKSLLPHVQRQLRVFASLLTSLPLPFRFFLLTRSLFCPCRSSSLLIPTTSCSAASFRSPPSPSHGNGTLKRAQLIETSHHCFSPGGSVTMSDW